MIVFKKYTILSLLFFAYIIVLAHSIVPHHHHDDHETELTTSHHDDDHEDENTLAHSFEKYLHSGESSDIYIKYADDASTLNFVLPIYLIYDYNFLVELVETCLTRHITNDIIPLPDYYNFPKNLRAPPYSLV